MTLFLDDGVALSDQWVYKWERASVIQSSRTMNVSSICVGTSLV